MSEIIDQPASGLDIVSIFTPPKSGLDLGGVVVTKIKTKARPSFYKGYVYSSRENALAGPFDTDFTAIASKPNSARVFAVNSVKSVYESDLLDLNNNEFEKPTNPWNFKKSFTPNSTPGIIATKEASFLYRGLFLESPFATPVKEAGELENPMYFENSTLAIAETHWMHFGGEAYLKDVYRIDLNFHRNSFGYLWLYAQTDSGKVSGQCKGFITDNMKVFTNLKGYRFRLKMFIATHEDYPWALREISVGYNQGKTF